MKELHKIFFYDLGRAKYIGQIFNEIAKHVNVTLAQLILDKLNTYEIVPWDEDPVWNLLKRQCAELEQNVELKFEHCHSFILYSQTNQLTHTQTLMYFFFLLAYALYLHSLRML